MLNIITAKFYSGTTQTWTDEAYQYDYGQVLQFDGLTLPDAYEVHFSNTPLTGETITQIGGADGVTIPDQFFTGGETIYAWVYLHEGEDDGKTVCMVTIPVKKRSQPSDDVPTPQEQSAITQTIAALNVAVNEAETAITHYPKIENGTWWVWDVTTGTWVDTEVEARGQQGEQGIQGIQGEQGVQGIPGVDGVSPTVTVTDITGGHRVAITDADGTQTFDVMDGEQGQQGVPGQDGAQGSPGANGQDGQDGYSPTVTVTNITGGHRVTITDADGAHTFDVMDGSGASITVDDALSSTSENPVQNKVINDALSDLSGLEEITWSALKAKRDAGTLDKGRQYRITDYVCTTTQEETRAVSHPFDIIVTADDESTLNENARACLHDGDNYYSAEGSYAKLEAWELKYRIDNDTSNFPWVDATNGKGVIYWMKDNFNNECPYDFKQIQFARYEITECEAVPSLVGKYTASEHGDAITAVDEENPVWCYTFSVEVNGDMLDATVTAGSVFENKISAFPQGEYNMLNGIVFIGGNCYSNTFGDGCGSNTFGDGCYYNTFGGYCYSNTFRDECYYNTFGDGCYSNTFGDGCYSNTFGDECESNTFGDGCYYNTFGGYCYSNTFGDNCFSNTFGDNCYSNTFRDECYSNTFGDNCFSNTFGDNCFSNTFGNNCESNTFGDYCVSNTFGDFCSYIDMQAGTNSSKKQYYTVLSGTQGTNNSHISITGTNGNNFATYVGKNSNGVLKTWVPADLAP